MLLFFVNVIVVFGDNTGGIFGNWTTDQFGLPAFEWTLNQVLVVCKYILIQANGFQSLLAKF